MDTQEDRPGCLWALLGIKPRANKSEAPDLSETSIEPSEESLGDRIGRVRPYVLVEQFLTPTELEFYHVLAKVASRYVIYSKVRIGDVLEIAADKGKRGWFNRIQSKHLDFLICDTDTTRPLLAIELDDSSHQRKERRDRDEFVDLALSSAGLPLLRYRARKNYSAEDVTAELKRAFAAK